MPWGSPSPCSPAKSSWCVCLLCCGGYGYGPPPVHYVGKTATFVLLMALPGAAAGRGSEAAAHRRALPSGWALAWWGIVLYWVAGRLLRGPGRGAGAGRRGCRAGVERLVTAAAATTSSPNCSAAPLDPGYADAARRKAERPPPAALAVARRPGRHRARGAADRVPARGRVPAGGRRRAATDQGPSATWSTTCTAAAPRPSSCSGRPTTCATRWPRPATTPSPAGGDAERLRELAAGTGLGKVTGDGVVVTLVDAPPQIDPVTGKPSDDNPGVVLDRDLQDIANALWQAGAEAIAVNGQRLTATSTIRTAGGAILVDFRPVGQPVRGRRDRAGRPGRQLRRLRDREALQAVRRHVPHAVRGEVPHGA